MRRLQKAASSLGARLFRQQVGMAWIGNKVERGPGVKHLGLHDIVIRNARPFHAGVPGMSDLGGWVPVEVTPDMLGSTVAVCAQVEIKEGGRASVEQLAWIEAVNNAGGRAGIARTEADLAEILFR
ncbi:hypothetical protein RFM23_05580 [Mesorhizobium abyssinicae]|uniref:VRR-NUC domain-containing protein n=1 Tax=Mesorhizobium abyssinicae TaxID=1209958 RepID=A0ABU5AIH7_9HYPH|nr:hypothetical protein [Mesorhizobium abyssinicae]MDX8537094.1 hypothetical protein [Mesorhizobium abyssinicae]